ncbi:tripartite motif-containing protein 16 isoform X2 [Corythoichthys intestinalis]|uniref:tripartite motif-containing protein 16 isoform X2 n=1 Tax=Corythoichthys intestinalis TaxID=161448 RepID=UPI0025A5A0CD|nr:tripartite motif-containing protein 16 isoform X2 [Corythoichthys intestinalis]
MSDKLWTEEQFNCPVCLDLPNDPVTIPCGHSYCMACIKDYWSKDDPKGIYSCPQCRQTFCPRPSLSRNTMLAEAVEQLRRGTPRSQVYQSIRGATKSKKNLPSSAVLCDLCKGERRAAVKTCLMCMSSYCEEHLKPHQTTKAMKEHELIAPTGNLAEKICTQHKYLQEFFCRQCKVFICWICTNNQHKGHESVSTKTERLEKEKGLSEMQAVNQKKLKDRQQELKDMKKMMDGMKRSAERVHSDSEKALLELQRSVERLQELLEEVLDEAGREKMEQSQEVVDNLEAEIRELKKRDTQMKDLAQCEDHIYYLQMYETMCSPLESGDLPAVQVNHDASFEPVRDAILDLRERVEDLCNQELGKINKKVSETTLFTLGGANRNQKAAFLKIFSALGSRNSNNRSGGSTSRSADRRKLGFRGQDVRSRDTSREVPQRSPRLFDRHRRDERESGGEDNLRPSPRPSPTPSPTPSRRGSSSLWSRSNQSQGVTATPTPTPVSLTPTQNIAPVQASTGAFSRMPSISSIFRSRRGNTHTASASLAGALPTLSEMPTEVNPSLFLDSPSPMANNHTPAFPALREISIDSIHAPEPREREDFLQYSVNFTLDPNSAHRRLVLSEGNTKATLQGQVQPYPDTPQRFDSWTQVMCGNPLYSQRSYWEVEWRGRGSSIGVAYGSLTRKGSDARVGIGYNVQSWTLELSDTCCTALHDNQKRDIPVTYSPRLGIYVDSSTGTLAFYSVAENMTHLHTFRANFTQPLYAVFGVGSGVGVGLDFALGQFNTTSDSIKLCPM